MKLSQGILPILFFVGGCIPTHGFMVGVPPLRKVESKTTAPSSSSMFASTNKQNDQIGIEAVCRNAFSSLIITTFISIGTLSSIDVNSAIATDVPLLDGGNIASSSIQLSKTITTMDMSLPSSYDAISDATASGLDELTVETNVLTNTSRKKAPPSARDDNSFSLPSFKNDDEPSLTDEERTALAAEKKAERDVIAAARRAEREAIAREKEAEREASLAARVAEKEALALRNAEENARRNAEREAERAEKKALAKAVKAEKVEKVEARASATKYNAVEIVDFSLPSYSDSASSDGKKDSVFAL